MHDRKFLKQLQEDYLDSNPSDADAGGGPETGAGTPGTDGRVTGATSGAGTPAAHSQRPSRRASALSADSNRAHRRSGRPTPSIEGCKLAAYSLLTVLCRMHLYTTIRWQTFNQKRLIQKQNSIPVCEQF